MYCCIGPVLQMVNSENGVTVLPQKPPICFFKMEACFPVLLSLFFLNTHLNSTGMYHRDLHPPAISISVMVSNSESLNLVPLFIVFLSPNHHPLYILILFPFSTLVMIHSSPYVVVSCAPILKIYWGFPWQCGPFLLFTIICSRGMKSDLAN